MALNVGVSDTVSVQNTEEVIAGDLAEDLTVRLRIASLIFFDIDILHGYVNVAELIVFRCLIVGTVAMVVVSSRECSTLSVLPHAEHIVKTHLRVYATIETIF